MKVVVVAILAAATMSVCFSIRRVLLEREGRAVRGRVRFSFVSFGFLHLLTKLIIPSFQYEASAEFVLENLRKNVEQRLLAVASFSTAISATARSQGIEWPFFMMPDWNEQAEGYKELLTSRSMGLVPFVTIEQRERWENFSVNSRDWIEQGYEWQTYIDAICDDQPPDRQRRLLPRILATNASSTELQYDNGYPTRIYTVDPKTSQPVPANGTLFAPFYHFSPAIARDRHFFYNMDMLSDPIFGPLLQILIESKQVVIGPVVVPQPEPSKFRSSLAYPFSLMYYPVFDDAYNQSIVAAVSLAFAWDSYFSDLLPSTLVDLVIILDFGCNSSSYTFLTGGSNTTFLGEGDDHDTLYDDWVLKYEFSTVRVKSGAGLNVDYCPYTVRLYPAGESLANDSNGGRISVTAFTIAVLAVFAFTSCIFLLYDQLVERRHNVVLSTAKRHGQFVSSLFPSGIRERVVDENYADETSSTISHSQWNSNRDPIAECEF